MNTLDIIVIAVVALSGLFAFMRGFVREILSIGAWVGAFAVAYYAFTPLQPITRRFIATAWIADTVTVSGLFIVGLLIFSVAVGALSEQVRASGLGPLDRVLGLVFGVARGVFFLCLLYLVSSRLLPVDNWPSWITDARTRPLIARGASALQDLIPLRMLDQGTKALGQAGQTVDNVSKAADLADTANEVLKSKQLSPETRAKAEAILQSGQNPLDSLRRAPQAKPADPATGYDSEQSREMSRAIQQSLGGSQK